MAKKIDIKSPFFTEPEETAPEQEAATKEKKPHGRPKNSELIRGGIQDGLTADLTRVTFILKLETVADLQNYAYTERLTIKDAVNDIIADFMTKYKAEHTLLESPKKPKKIEKTTKPVE